MTENYEGSIEIAEAVRATGERIENQLGLLVQVAERIAIALERQAALAERVTEERPPPA
jgi:hypothetical protein